MQPLRPMPLDSVIALHAQLFHALNPDVVAGGSVPLVIGVARFASEVLPPVLIGALFAALVLAPNHVRRRILLVLASMALAWLAARAIQVLWPQPRPFALDVGEAWLAHAHSPSLPSMHATVAAVFALSLSMSFGWRMAVVTVPLAGLIAWSRICLGLHFPVDVLAGLLVGTVATLWTHACFSAPRVRWMGRVMRRRLRLRVSRGGGRLASGL